MEEYKPIKYASHSPPPTAAQQAAIQPILNLTEDLRKNTFTNLHQHILPAGHAVNLRPPSAHFPTGIRHLTLAELMTYLETALKPSSSTSPDGGPRFEYFAEPLYDVEFWIDGDIALVWAPFDVYTDVTHKGTLSHVGSDVFMLARVPTAVQGAGKEGEEGKEIQKEWKISYLVDTARFPSHNHNKPSPPPLRYTGPSHQDPADETAILSAVNSLLTTFKEDNLPALHEICLPGIVWTLYRDGNVRYMTTEEFVQYAGPIIKGRDVVEKLVEPVVVRVDHDVAMVWSGFTCHIDGRLDHYGSDMFTLAKIGGRWLVTGVGDNNYDA